MNGEKFPHFAVDLGRPLSSKAKFILIDLFMWWAFFMFDVWYVFVMFFVKGGVPFRPTGLLRSTYIHLFLCILMDSKNVNKVILIWVIWIWVIGLGVILILHSWNNVPYIILFIALLFAFKAVFVPYRRCLQSTFLDVPIFVLKNYFRLQTVVCIILFFLSLISTCRIMPPTRWMSYSLSMVMTRRLTSPSRRNFTCRVFQTPNKARIYGSI